MAIKQTGKDKYVIRYVPEGVSQAYAQNQENHQRSCAGCEQRRPNGNILDISSLQSVGRRSHAEHTDSHLDAKQLLMVQSAAVRVRGYQGSESQVHSDDQWG